MTTIRALHHFVICPKCRESVFAAERSEYVSTTEVHHLWCCWRCQLKFETLDHLAAETIAPYELITKNLPAPLAA